MQFPSGLREGRIQRLPSGRLKTDFTRNKRNCIAMQWLAA